MNVKDAVQSRFSARAFTDRSVPGEIVRDILDVARQSPSGGNLQPWHVYAIGGDEMAAFKALMRKRIEDEPRGEGWEYTVYPDGLADPYRARRYKCGYDLYGALDIARDDKPARRRQFLRNFEFFDAPVGLFICIERMMGPPQWADLGMYLQTIMLLARGHDLHTCPQEAWALWHRTVGEFLDLPADLMVFCGVALGYADGGDPANNFRTDRAEIKELAHFRGL